MNINILSEVLENHIFFFHMSKQFDTKNVKCSSHKKINSVIGYSFLGYKSFQIRRFQSQQSQNRLADEQSAHQSCLVMGFEISALPVKNTNKDS